MNKKLLRKKLALMLANLKKKRPFYTEVEYLENTGTGENRNWINTGIVPNNNTRWEVRVAFNNTSTRKLMGSGFATPTRFNLGIESNKFRFAFNAWFDANQNIITPDTNAHTWIMDASSKTFTIDEYSTTPTYTFGTSTYPICLFCRSKSASGNTEINNNSLCKIYYTKIWDNGTLVRDMIPVLDWNMTPCMYDKVSGELFYNQGTGNFSYGREIHYVDYLESTGTQYIDTGIKGKSGISAKTKVNYTYLSGSASHAIGGEYASNTSCYFGMVRANGHFTYLYKTSVVETTTTLSTNTDYDIDITLSNGNQRFVINGNVVSTGTVSGDFTSTNNLFLYAINSVNGADVYGSLKMYYMQISDNGTLVRDFIPAISEDGTAFMFDRVTHTCFLNQGTGAFVPASYQLDENGRVVEPEYE